MRVSIVIAVLDSHEVVSRQIWHFAKMPLPDDCEVILVDDGSNPPLHTSANLPWLTILYHHHPAAWTQPAARNLGCRHSKADYLICTDIDHILTLDLINAVRETTYDFMKFRREVAILDEHGDFVQTPEAMLAYGFEQRRLDKGGFHIPPHTNSFAVKREVYWQAGGVSERRIGTGIHPNREEVPFRNRLYSLRREGKITIMDEDSPGERPMLYMFPNGRYCGEPNFNPFGLFHNLPRKTRVA